MTRVRWNALREALESVEASFDPTARLAHDPLGIVRGYPQEERELVAHIVAPLAYGSIPQVRRAAREVLSVLGRAPTDAVREMRPGDFVSLRPHFVYRMTRAVDVDAYLSALGALLRRFGGLEPAFGEASRGVDGDAHQRLAPYVAMLRSEMPHDAGRGARYLTADPATGSAAKRWHLMLRWLCRDDDGVDLGLWSVVPRPELVLPLDTHTSRLVQWLGLSRRKTVDYRMAREATDGLLRLDASDPMRFDMPLCHLGVSGACRHRFVVEVCTDCGLKGCCRWTTGAAARRALGRSLDR